MSVQHATDHTTEIYTIMWSSSCEIINYIYMYIPYMTFVTQNIVLHICAKNICRRDERDSSLEREYVSIKLYKFSDFFSMWIFLQI